MYFFCNIINLRIWIIKISLQILNKILSKIMRLLLIDRESLILIFSNFLKNVKKNIWFNKKGIN